MCLYVHGLPVKSAFAMAAGWLGSTVCLGLIGIKQSPFPSPSLFATNHPVVGPNGPSGVVFAQIPGICKTLISRTWVQELLIIMMMMMLLLLCT